MLEQSGWRKRKFEMLEKAQRVVRAWYRGASCAGGRITKRTVSKIKCLKEVQEDPGVSVAS